MTSLLHILDESPSQTETESAIEVVHTSLSGTIAMLFF